MNSSEKTAIMRIFIDLIKADNILDIAEMNFMFTMRKKYQMTNENIIEAQKIDFALAVNALQNLPDNLLNGLLDDVKKLAVSDNYCAPEEALLLMSLDFCLQKEYKGYCKLISTPITNISIDKFDIIYTETSYDEDFNNIISQNLRYIADDFKLSGLEFVYIPQIAKDFACMKENYLRDVINLLAPTLSNSGQNSIYETLKSITTERFSDEFLVNKIGLDPLIDSDPSLLLQICNSNEKIVYLHIMLQEDLLNSLMEFVDKYKSVTRIETSNRNYYRNNCDRFFYYGFHRALFDILAFPGKNIESDIVIDIIRKKIHFVQLEQTMTLHAKQFALYLLIIHQSICTKCKELQYKTTSSKKKKEIDYTFAQIYGKLSAHSAPDFRKDITQSLSQIKGAFHNITFLDNAKAYIPNRGNYSIFVRIKPDKVFVKDFDGKVVLMTESEEWTYL